jgi:hypothetical protein
MIKYKNLLKERIFLLILTTHIETALKLHLWVNLSRLPKWDLVCLLKIFGIYLYLWETFKRIKYHPYKWQSTGEDKAKLLLEYVQESFLAAKTY